MEWYLIELTKILQLEIKRVISSLIDGSNSQF